MTNWQRGANGYSAVISKSIAPATAAALEGNENFQKGEAFQRDDPDGTKEQAPQTLQFNVSIGFDLFKAFERKFHEPLRGVKLNDRLDRLQALIDSATTNEDAAKAYAEIVEASFGAPA